MPEKSLSEIEEQIQEAEEEIRTVRGKEQLEALKKKKRKKLKKKRREAKLKKSKTGRTIANISDQLGNLLQQPQGVDTDGDGKEDVRLEAETTGGRDPADEITGEIEVSGTLEFEADDIELEGRSPDRMEPRDPTSLPPALETRENQDDDRDDRGIGSLPSSGF
jgi:TolA-binding protein